MSASEARTQQSTTVGGQVPAEGQASSPSSERGAPRTDAGQPDRPAQDTQEAPAASPQAPRTGQRPGQARPAAPAGSTQRRVRLSVSRIDPWSALKLSFLLSVVVGIALVVAAGALWTVLDAVGVYDSANQLIADFGGPSGTDVTNFVGFSQVVSAATVLAVVDVVLLTALATLGAIVYNVSAALVGGLRVTLTDD